MRLLPIALIGPMALVSVIPFSMWSLYNGTYPAWQAVRASLLMSVVVVLIIGCLTLVMRSTSKASTVTTLLICGMLTLYINLIVVSMLLGIMIIIVLSDRVNAYRNINIVTFIMGFSLLSGAAWPPIQESMEERQIVSSDDPLGDIELLQKPSIIHVVLDGYGTSDILSNIYDHDSEPFFTALEERGFVVARKASVPFSQTLPSMASVFSGAVVDVGSRTNAHTLRRDLGFTITNGPVATVLDEAGYTLGGNRSGYGHLDRLQGGLLSSNLAGLTELEAALFISDKNVFADVHNHTLISSLEPGLFDDIQQPFFYYQHLLAPHPPFSLNADGSTRAVTSDGFADGNHAIRQLKNGRAEYIEGYRQKALFIESALLQQIDSYPAGPKIVLIHGDHGPGAHLDHGSDQGTCMAERLQTFMAFYSNVPGVSFSGLADNTGSVSTVNAYREIFGRLGEEKLPSLPTNSFFLSWQDPMSAIEVAPESLGSECN